MNIHSRNQVLLEAKLRHKKTVRDVFRSENQFDRTINRDCERRNDGIILDIRIGVIKADVVQSRIVDQVWIGAAEHVVLAGIMKVPTKLLCDYFNLKRSRRSGMEIKRRPNSLAHYGETNEDDCGSDGPDDFQTIVAMRIGRALGAGIITKLEDYPAQANLRRGEGHADHNDRDHELAIHESTMFRNRLRKPPLSADEHPDGK